MKLKLENWKAICQPMENDKEPIIIDLLAFDHMDVFNRTFSTKDIRKLLVAVREKDFNSFYTEEAKNKYWNKYKTVELV